jgi:hypothetical protein
MLGVVRQQFRCFRLWSWHWSTAIRPELFAVALGHWVAAAQEATLSRRGWPGSAWRCQ